MRQSGYHSEEACCVNYERAYPAMQHLVGCEVNIGRRKEVVN